MPNETVLERLKRLMAERDAAFERWDADPNWGAIHKAALDALPSLIAAVEALECIRVLAAPEATRRGFEAMDDLVRVDDISRAALAPLLKEVPHE